MKERFLLLSRYFLFWLVYFVLAKLFFLLFNQNFGSELTFRDYLAVFYHGLLHDVSVSSYILFLSSLIMGLFLFKTQIVSVFFKFYTIILILIFNLLNIIDTKLYGHWGFRLDATPLLYLTDIQALTASVPIFQGIALFIVAVALSFAFFKVYEKWIHVRFSNFKKISYWHSIIFLILSVLIVIPMRGGIGTIPIKTSSVYFHKVPFANHAAINPIWNFIYSILKSDVASIKISFMETEEAEKIVENLTTNNEKAYKILNTQRPNILLIALESLSSKIIEHPNATPFLKKLTQEAVYFSNFYASGDRTDRAMVALLSGYPSFPNRNIISFPKKTESLPFLSKELKKLGYYNRFYYGGSLSFANYQGFLTNGQFEQLVSIEDFESKDLNSKWGAHDHVVFDRMLRDLNNKPHEPFFTFMFTTSSHEPFDVPMKTVIEGNSEDSLFFNAAHYADKSLQQFIEKAKKSTWWKNTLVILVADHGTIIPFNTPNHAAEKFQIPMIWLGGALSVKDTTIAKYASQTDIAKTLLTQLNAPCEDFIFSNNLFSQDFEGYAFYAFNNGFGFMEKELKLIFDNNTGKYIYTQAVTDSLQLNYGKAFLQVLSDDFQKR